MAKRPHNKNDLTQETMQRLRAVSRSLSNKRANGFEIDPDFDSATIVARVAMLFSSLGEMPAADSAVVRKDSTQPWGPKNLRWGRIGENGLEPSLNAGHFSPTAQCPKCSSYKTKTASTDREAGIRRHFCKICKAKFKTAIEDLETVTRPRAPRKNLKQITHDGRSMTIAEWAAVTGISAAIISSRLCLGWDVARALTVKPIRRKK